ncbi:MAG TPA: CidA/LrgA family protein [Pusillimonas sp.]|uniref:CidA/LrgA family protein n=1 Tax=Pusillimonas sp. TaxID=3040095 RepID=UPI002C5719A6|nr:CidA/LrgA family protein [Pusillimonas sp.]HUH87451.1 CidA/LrgA family protein [Pusillimonas sp.]
MPVICVLALLLGLQLVGEWVVRLTGMPLPGGLIGLLLLLGGLVWLGRLPIALRQTTHHVLQHLILFFIPAVAGVMLHFELLMHEWLPFVLACVGGTVITITATALTLSWMLKRQRSAAQA